MHRLRQLDPYRRITLRSDYIPFYLTLRGLGLGRKKSAKENDRDCYLFGQSSPLIAATAFRLAEDSTLVLEGFTHHLCDPERDPVVECDAGALKREPELCEEDPMPREIEAGGRTGAA